MINDLNNKIIQHLKAAGRPQSANEISEAVLTDSGDDYTQVVKTLAEMEAKGSVTITNRGSFRLAEDLVNQVEGLYRANAKGFGFVSVEGEDEDVYISRGSTGGAMQGDQVKVKITRQAQPWKEKGPEGQVVEILSRSVDTITGEFIPFDEDEKAATGYIGRLEALNKKIGEVKIMVLGDGLKPVDGTICQATIKTYPNPDQPDLMEVLVIQEIGHKNQPGVDILSVLYMFQIPHEFPQDVLEEANQVPDEVQEKEMEGRRDLRDVLTITIDGADAKDLDDAISYRVDDRGYHVLSVHIADVTHYVTEGSLMDREALVRGTSVYLTDRVVPMLPVKLSNGICSLNPRVTRLTMTAEMTFNNHGEAVGYELYPSVIKSDYRMTYTDVNTLLASEDPDLEARYTEIMPILRGLHDLHTQLLHDRQKRGAIDFDSPEAQILVDSEGHPTDIVLRERGEGERMIESFMLAANETVANHVNDLDLPFIYRIHEDPDSERLSNFITFAASLGLRVENTKKATTPKGLQSILNKVKGEDIEFVVSTSLLRSMKQAKYDTQPIGHFGLAAEDYTHFTAPIRRYPDILVHRYLKKYLAKYRPSGEDRKELLNQLQDMADQTSMLERRAIDAERETDALKKAEYMEDKVGQVFEGIIGSVTSFGLFIELPNTVEGLIHVSTLKGDFYKFIKNHQMLLGERNGVAFRLGQRVEVKLAGVDVAARNIDFELTDNEINSVKASGDLLKASRKESDKKRGHKPRDHRSSRKSEGDQRRGHSRKKEDGGRGRQERRRRK